MFRAIKAHKRKTGKKNKKKNRGGKKREKRETPESKRQPKGETETTSAKTPRGKEAPCNLVAT